MEVLIRPLAREGTMLQRPIHNIVVFYSFYFAAIMAFIGLLALVKWIHSTVEARRARHKEACHDEKNEHPADPALVRAVEDREHQADAAPVGLSGDEHGGEAGAIGRPAEHPADGLAARQAALGINEHGEIKGCGPLWACDAFGATGHNYQECRVCMARFDSWMEIQRRIYMYPGPGWGMP